MNKASYLFAAFVMAFTMSAQAQSGTNFSPAYSPDEVQAAGQMSPTQTMAQRQEVLQVRTIPNPWVTLEPTVGYVSSTFTGISGINGASVDSVSRMQGGVGVLIGRGMWQGETGLLYSQRGGQLNNITDSTGTQKANFDFNLTYIDVPLMGRFSWPHSSRSHFFARAGVIVGFLTDAKFDAQITSTNSLYGSSYNVGGTDAKQYFTSTDVRGAFGAGYDWKFSRNVGWVVQADVQESLAKVNDGTFLKEQDVTNFGLVFSTGVTIKM